MGLEPLEFSECLTDGPYFRDKLHVHEKELERTNKAVKGLIKEMNDVLTASGRLSEAQRNFAKTLHAFQFECIENQKTDDEVIIEQSLKEFGKTLSNIEDARDRMLLRASTFVIQPLEQFRKQQFGEAKEVKRKFDKQTSKFCQSQERYLKLNKMSESQFLEEDTKLIVESRTFYQESMQYVLRMQEVQERKKFEFVEILLQFMYGWSTFYHEVYDLSDDFNPYMTDLSYKLQKCRGNFDATKEEVETLMKKTLENPEYGSLTAPRTFTKEGYLFLMEKKALVTTVWSKYFCQYRKDGKSLTMIAYNQVAVKSTSANVKENYSVTSCVRRATDSIDKRFCFDITVQEKSQPLTVQAISDDDRRAWLDAMDGKEPIYLEPKRSSRLDGLLDDLGFSFVKKCITTIEAQGLEEEGLYRVVGVLSKVSRLTSLLLDRKKADQVNLDSLDSEWDLRTITSALKSYFRSLPEPLMTFKLHHQFIRAAKKESKALRINDIHELVHKLPESNLKMLDVIVGHLKKVSERSQKNLMTVANLGVCFGPTLMRPEEETVAAIMDIKFCNLIVEILIDDYMKIFTTAPEFSDVANTRQLNSKPPTASAASLPPRKPTKGSAPPSASSSQTNQTPGSRTGSVSGSSVSGSRDGVPACLNSSVKLSRGYDNNNGSSSALQSPLTGDTYADAKAKLRPTQTDQQGVESTNVRSSTSVSQLRRGQPTSTSTGSREIPNQGVRRGKARTLYACTAENDRDLSFEPNQIIENVHDSKKPGWLEGCLNGKTGLIPSNYVKILDDEP